MPTLCIAGEEDVVVPPKAVGMIAELLGGATLVTVPRTGHSVYLERPDRFNTVVRSFLRKCSA